MFLPVITTSTTRGPSGIAGVLSSNRELMIMRNAFGHVNTELHSLKQALFVTEKGDGPEVSSEAERIVYLRKMKQTHIMKVERDLASMASRYELNAGLFDKARPPTSRHAPMTIFDTLTIESFFGAGARSCCQNSKESLV
jgi:hypothetical protein